MGRLAQHIGRGRGHHHQIEALGNLHMGHPAVGIFGELLLQHRVPGEGSECGRTDKFGRRPGHGDRDIGPFTAQAADQLGGLEGGDGATHPDQDALPLEGTLVGAHSSALAGARTGT